MYSIWYLVQYPWYFFGNTFDKNNDTNLLIQLAVAHYSPSYIPCTCTARLMNRWSECSLLWSWISELSSSKSNGKYLGRNGRNTLGCNATEIYTKKVLSPARVSSYMTCCLKIIESQTHTLINLFDFPFFFL